MLTTFLNILAIIGLIVVGAMIIYFLASLILSASGREGKGSCRRQKTIRPTVLQEEETPEPETKALSWDETQAAKEESMILSGDNMFREDFEQESQKGNDSFDEFDDIFGDRREEDEEIDQKEIDRMIEEINQESLAEYQATSIKDESLPESQEEEKDTLFNEEQVNLFDDLGLKEAGEDKDDDEDGDQPDIEEMKRQLEADRADLEEQKRLLAEEKSRLAELKEQESTMVPVASMSKVYEGESADELRERLELLQARLKANERDLKENNREYKPLARVKKSLEKDKDKLRRREAVVARKKVLLYGVNNYVDIDEDKAKKLNEDLDLLDGLRLSVQHCEDVMNANKDRFPILEKTDRILTEIHEQILADIAEVEASIAQKSE